MNRSKGTSLGMKRWHMTIPRCSYKKCKTRLVDHDRRGNKSCAKHNKVCPDCDKDLKIVISKSIDQCGIVTYYKCKECNGTFLSRENKDIEST